MPTTTVYQARLVASQATESSEIISPRSDAAPGPDTAGIASKPWKSARPSLLVTRTPDDLPPDDPELRAAWRQTVKTIRRGRRDTKDAPLVVASATMATNTTTTTAKAAETAATVETVETDTTPSTEPVVLPGGKRSQPNSRRKKKIKEKKKMEATQASNTPQTPAPNGSGQKQRKKSKEMGANEASNTPQRPATNMPDLDQVKLLANALTLLKDALTVNAPLLGATKNAKTDSTSGVAKQSRVQSGTAKKNAARKPVQKTPKQRESPAPKSRKETVEEKAHERPLSTVRVQSISAGKLALTPVEKPRPPVPRLEYGLDRALFNPGVYHLQDPRSKVYNFDPYLASIMPVQEFDFNALKRYVTSSQDDRLISIAAEYKKKYTGSTSSMTQLLAHFHYLLSAWRPINPGNMSQSFAPESFNFTRINRAASAAFLHRKGEVYAIDADKEFDNATVLSLLGKSMEKLLTLPTAEFEKYRISKSHEITDEERNASEAFHYTTLGDFMMRSQLDACDPRLPGSGMFDLKTRAVVSIRMAASDPKNGLGYEIRKRFGQWESFEREYFDMIRSAFLKYSLQVRMGRMDGIYVAFHNTERIFGFQYISVNEMDLAIHGTEDRRLGDDEFKLSLRLLNEVLDMATAKFPDRSLRVHIETRPSESAPFMYIFAKPVDSEEIANVQDANKASIEAIERDIVGMKTSGAEADKADEAVEMASEPDESWPERLPPDDNDYQEAQSHLVWETMRRKVEETMDNEALGIPSLRETLEDALEESGLLHARSQAEINRYLDALLEAITNPEPESIAKSIEGTSAGDPEHASVGSQDIEGDLSSEDVLVEDEVDSEESETLLDDPEEEASAITDADEGLQSRRQGDGTEGGTDAVEPEDVAVDSLVEGIKTKDSSHADDIVFEDDQMSELESEEQPDQYKPTPVTKPGLPLDNISLKDLIIRLAGQMDATPMAGDEQSDADSSPELVEAPRNKRFEKILKDLAASAKFPAVTPGEGVQDESSTKEQETNASTSDEAAQASSEDPGAETEELLGLILTIRNRVSGAYVARPKSYGPGVHWSVEYAIEEMPDKRAHSLYEAVLRRRRALFRPPSPPSPTRAYSSSFLDTLEKYSAAGRKFRAEENQRARKRPVEVYGASKQRRWDEVFKRGGEGSP